MNFIHLNMPFEKSIQRKIATNVFPKFSTNGSTLITLLAVSNYVYRVYTRNMLATHHRTRHAADRTKTFHMCILVSKRIRERWHVSLKFLRQIEYRSIRNVDETRENSNDKQRFLHRVLAPFILKSCDKSSLGYKDGQTQSLQSNWIFDYILITLINAATILWSFQLFNNNCDNFIKAMILNVQ